MGAVGIMRLSCIATRGCDPLVVLGIGFLACTPPVWPAFFAAMGISQSAVGNPTLASEMVLLDSGLPASEERWPL